ncbi:MAG TPA: hypothetical protein VJ782_07555 [Aeromicrobium sp.]|nr:hypothetical protein [Aeromicrobium sp.]
MRFTDADVLVYVYAFAVLGALTLGLGLFLRGRIDGLIDDPKLPGRLSEDEREYRGSQLATGVLTMLVVGTLLLLAALGLYIWGV